MFKRIYRKYIDKESKNYIKNNGFNRNKWHRSPEIEYCMLSAPNFRRSLSISSFLGNLYMILTLNS